MTLRYLGTAVTRAPTSPRSRKTISGIKIEYVPVTTDDVTKRVVTQPNSFDMVDTEYFWLKKLAARPATFKGMDAKKIKNRRQDHPRVHQGRGGRQEDRRPGHGAEEGDLPGGQDIEEVRGRADASGSP